MLFLCIGTLVVYFLNAIDPSHLVARFICFDRNRILHGELWRLFTYVISPASGGIWLFLLLFAYYSIGRMLESVWGTLKFNLFYLCGVVLMDIGALVLGTTASPHFLNLSLFLALATTFPENRVLFMYIIPLKMKYLAWFYLGITLYDAVAYHDFSGIIALLNYFLFFGRDFLNVLPGNLAAGSTHKSYSTGQRPNKNWAKAYQKNSGRQSTTTKAKVVNAPEYRHKCTICGRTDVSHPTLEFRYCSKCAGYYCYCEDHISNHSHITQ